MGTISCCQGMEQPGRLKVPRARRQLEEAERQAKAITRDLLEVGKVKGFR